MHRNIAANYFGRLYSAASVYLFVPFYISLLGVESYGVIAFYAVLLTFAGLADVGMSSVLAREAARQSRGEALATLLTSIELIVLSAAGIFAISVFLAAGPIANRWLKLQGVLEPAVVANAIRLMALMIVPQLVFALYIGGLMGLQQQVRANVIHALFITVRAGLVIPLIYWRPNLELFFAWQAVATLAFALIARAALATTIGARPFGLGRLDFSVVAPHLQFTAGLFVISVVAILNTQLDKLLVSKLFPIDQFSYYVLSGTLAQLPLVAIGPLVAAFLPRLTVLTEQGHADQASRLYESCCYFVAVLSSAGSFAVILFAEDLLSLWLGRQDIPREVVLVSKILATGSLFLSIATTPYYLGLANGDSRTSAIVTCMALALSIPLFVFLAARLGLIGAAMPWVVLNAATLAILATVIHQRYYKSSATKWWLKFTILPAALAALPIATARLFADATQLGPLLACCTMALAGAAGVTAIAWAKNFRS